MPKMTPEQQTAYALDFEVARSDPALAAVTGADPVTATSGSLPECSSSLVKGEPS
jgi:hypothetical protein